MGGMQRALVNQGKEEYYDLALNSETAKYLYKLLAVKDLVEHPSKYGVKLYKWRREPLRNFKITSTIDNLEVFAKSNGTNLFVLHLYNPWLLKKTLTIKKQGTFYTIELPIPRKNIIKDSLTIIPAK